MIHSQELKDYIIYLLDGIANDYKSDNITVAHDLIQTYNLEDISLLLYSIQTKAQKGFTLKQLDNLRVLASLLDFILSRSGANYYK